MWIKTLKIENFQSHKNTELNFHPHFNILVGTGNSGKSAIIRSLSFILFGEWDSSWINHDASKCQISLKTDTGIEVIREKGQKLNKYIVRVPDKKEQVYENFGVHVPEEIEKLLGISKAKVTDKDDLTLNLSSQLDQLFLLSNPGSYKAKVLGKLSKAHYLDYALREINKDKKKLSSEKTLLEKQLVELEKELLDYKDLEAKKQLLNDVGTKLSQLEHEQIKIDKLTALFSKTTVWKYNYNREKRKIEELNKVRDFDLSSITAKCLELQNIGVLARNIHNMDYELTAEQKRLTDRTTTGAELKEKYLKLLKDNNLCPTCFQEVDGDKCKNIVEKL